MITNYKCPHCDCLFLNQLDLDLHLKHFGPKHGVAWKKFHDKIDEGDDEVSFKDVVDKLNAGNWRVGTYGGEIMSMTDPSAEFYKLLCKESCGEWIASGSYEYKVSGNGKWIVRRTRNAT